MARPRLDPGEVGVIRFTTIREPQGRTPGIIQADASYGSETGLQRVRVQGRTRAIAEKKLRARVAERMDAAEAAARAAEAAAEAAKTAQYERPVLVTVGDAAQAWLATLPALRRSPTTIAEYRRVVRGDILPALGDVRLADLHLGLLLNWRLSISDGTAPQREVDQGERHGLTKRVDAGGSVTWHLPARKATVRGANVALERLRQVLDHAVVSLALERNPLRDIEPLEEDERPDPEAPTPEQVQALLLEVHEWARRRHPGPRWTTFGVYVSLLATTGMRPGECLGLRVCDIDLTEGHETVEVNGTVVTTTGKGAFRKASPKSRHGNRRLVIVPWVAELLREMIPAHADPEAPLFPSSAQGYVWRAPAAVRQKWGRFVAASSALENGSRQYALRKAVATQLERQLGIDAVPGQMGHGNIKVSKGHYVVPNRQSPHGAVEVLEVFRPRAS